MKIRLATSPLPRPLPQRERGEWRLRVRRGLIAPPPRGEGLGERWRAARGLTLIEITISLLIVGLLMLAVVPAVESVTGVRARETAGKLAGMVRYLYNESSLTGKPCRLVFDLDARAYWAECTEGRFTLGREKEESRNGHRVEEKKDDKDVDSSPGFSLDDADQAKAERKRIEHQADFADFSDDEVGKSALPSGVQLAVWVDHQHEKYTKGQAYLYFFPQGYTERAQIYVSTGSTVYTLKIAPLTGKATVVPDELDLPRDVR